MKNEEGVERRKPSKVAPQWGMTRRRVSLAKLVIAAVLTVVIASLIVYVMMMVSP